MISCTNYSTSFFSSIGTQLLLLFTLKSGWGESDYKSSEVC
uniref:Uncharacterized protein n=1 Tax=Arundo donax TaxID=35708 RepID=A0A0A9GDC0_ARUDO